MANMKTIFDETTRDELIRRINMLNVNTKAQWGKMNLNQMLKHFIFWDESVLGKRKLKQPLIGKLFGKFFLRKLIKDDTPLPHSLPSVDELKVEEGINSDLSVEKKKWISLIKEYPKLSNHTYELPFFGEVKKEHAGYLAYKHTDHHLRQFYG